MGTSAEIEETTEQEEVRWIRDSVSDWMVEHIIDCETGGGLYYNL